MSKGSSIRLHLQVSPSPSSAVVHHPDVVPWKHEAHFPATWAELEDRLLVSPRRQCRGINSEPRSTACRWEEASIPGVLLLLFLPSGDRHTHKHTPHKHNLTRDWRGLHRTDPQREPWCISYFLLHFYLLCTCVFLLDPRKDMDTLRSSNTNSSRAESWRPHRTMITIKLDSTKWIWCWFFLS